MFDQLEFIFLTVVYLLPTVIAAVKRSKNLLGVVVINVLLGWTIIGWVVAMVIACWNQRPVVPASKEVAEWDQKHPWNRL
ncbi:hypothetical protein SEA_EPSOCAMISIO_38 [Gordonia phage Epsocamisio]|nr:hypothetical protein SEA_EPSOCAMISIO_38 [Gordonia phage Epsocamisio]